MPIKLNGTTFNNGGTVTFNGQTVKEIKFGTTTVWKASQTIFGDGTDLSVNNYVCTTDGSSADWISGTESIHGNVWCKITKTAGSSIVLQGNNGGIGYNSALVVSSSTVPSASYTTMKITYKNSGDLTGGTANKEIAVGLKSASGTSPLNTYGGYGTGTYKSIPITSQTSATTVSLDISSVTTNQYLYMILYNPASSNGGSVTISKIVFE